MVAPSFSAVEKRFQEFRNNLTGSFAADYTCKATAGSLEAYQKSNSKLFEDLKTKVHVSINKQSGQALIKAFESRETIPQASQSTQKAMNLPEIVRCKKEPGLEPPRATKNQKIMEEHHKSAPQLLNELKKELAKPKREKAPSATNSNRGNTASTNPTVSPRPPEISADVRDKIIEFARAIAEWQAILGLCEEIPGAHLAIQSKIKSVHDSIKRGKEFIEFCIAVLVRALKDLMETYKDAQEEPERIVAIDELRAYIISAMPADALEIDYRDGTSRQTPTQNFKRANFHPAGVDGTQSRFANCVFAGTCDYSPARNSTIRLILSTVGEHGDCSKQLADAGPVIVSSSCFFTKRVVKDGSRVFLIIPRVDGFPVQRCSGNNPKKFDPNFACFTVHKDVGCILETFRMASRVFDKLYIKAGKMWKGEHCEVQSSPEFERLDDILQTVEAFGTAFISTHCVDTYLHQTLMLPITWTMKLSKVI